MKKLMLIACGVLAGCGTVAKSTGPMSLGPDTFRITTRAPMGAVGESQKMALGEGQAYCAGLHREFMTIGTRQLPASYFEVTFRCLVAGDPDLQRPNLQPTPSAIIQMR